MSGFAWARSCGSLAAIALVLLAASSALAQEPPRQRTEKLLTELGAAKAPADALVVKSKAALSRAAQARSAGDNAHGSQLEALALELAETAKDLARASEAEARVTTLEKKALELETRVIRGRALVEQAAARRGRAAERLREVEAQREAAPPAKKPTASPKAGSKP